MSDARGIQHQSIDGVIGRIDRIIDRCIREKSRLGYFAVLYRDVTVNVRSAIHAGAFEDNARMERLDVIFASRYLDALEHFWAGRTPTQSWLFAFRSALLTRPVILQHLLLGMHAHINLDLAIAAAQAAPRGELQSLQPDFMRITTLLDGMIQSVQDRIKRVSPWMHVVDRVGGRHDERIVGFGIREARELSWKAAQILANAGPAFEQEILLHDHVVAALAPQIQSPGPYLSSVLQVIRAREVSDVPRVISALREHSP
jgi:hypothetical protein